jgi:hypothetical protein
MMSSKPTSGPEWVPVRQAIVLACAFESNYDFSGHAIDSDQKDESP